MKISIAERLHPFSHRPGTCCVLPKSLWQVEAFPALLRFHRLSKPHSSFELHFDIVGPVQEFTVELDLERGVVWVFGRTREGYLRYQIQRQKEGIALVFEKTPKGLSCQRDGHKHALKEKETLFFAEAEEPPHFSEPERLSLGMHKSQDWDLVVRRQDLKEIFPIWIRLGQILPSAQEPLTPIGTFRLLLRCQELVAERKSLLIGPHFLQLFQTAFSGICAPRLKDEEYQGILPTEEAIPSDLSPLPLLTEGAQLIRSLFFQDTQGVFEFLPCLLPDFAAGSFIGTHIAFNWSKHRLKKVKIQATGEAGALLRFPKNIQSFRVRSSLKERGKVHPITEGKADLAFKGSQLLYLDRFEK